MTDWNKILKPRPYSAGEWVVYLLMSLVALFATIHGLAQGYLWYKLIAFVFIMTCTPWLIYNVAAHIFGWNKLTMLELFELFVDIVMSFVYFI